MTTGNQNGIYTLEIATRVLSQVASGLRPTWSPNDSDILFINQSEKLCKVRLATGSITNLGISGNMPDWRRF